MQEQTSFWVWSFVLNIGHVFLIPQTWRTFELCPWCYECDVMEACTVFSSPIELGETRAINKMTTQLSAWFFHPEWRDLASIQLRGQSGTYKNCVFLMLPFWCFSGFSSHFPVHWKVRIPDSSVGKESACNAGDPSSIPGSGRSSGEGISYPLLYSWASLVAQLLKNPPAMRETWDQSLGWENPLKKGTTTHSRILAWRIPWTV